MKAHDLAKALLDGPNVEVLISSDDEGNHINRVSDESITFGTYDSKDIDISVGVSDSYMLKNRDKGYTSEDVLPDNCIILYPN